MQKRNCVCLGINGLENLEFNQFNQRMNAITNLQRLEAIGFRPVGHWRIENEKILLHLDDCKTSTNILYSFVIEGMPVYIGKTIQMLKSRLYGYAKPGSTQSTNKRGNKKIREELAAGKAIQIYALPDHGLLYFGGFHLNLAAALEDAIVVQLKPVWNMTGMKNS